MTAIDLIYTRSQYDALQLRLSDIEALADVLESASHQVDSVSDGTFSQFAWKLQREAAQAKQQLAALAGGYNSR